MQENLYGNNNNAESEFYNANPDFFGLFSLVEEQNQTKILTKKDLKKRNNVRTYIKAAATKFRRSMKPKYNQAINNNKQLDQEMERFAMRVHSLCTESAFAVRVKIY